jgi:hypothetical protein
MFSFLGDVLQGVKKLYRAPLDYLEEVTTGMADTVFVNSGFTKEVTVFFACWDVPKFIMSDPGPNFQMNSVLLSLFFVWFRHDPDLFSDSELGAGSTVDPAPGLQKS